MSQQNQPSSNLKPSLKAVTPAHLIVSVLITALTAAGDAGLQYFQSNGGSFSLVQLVGAAGAALFATLATGVITLEHNPTIEQAIDGKLAEYAGAFNQVLSQHKMVVDQGAQLVYYLTELAQKQANTPVAQPVVQGMVTPLANMTTSINPQAPLQGSTQIAFPPLTMPGPLTQPGSLVRDFSTQTGIPVVTPGQ